MCVRVCTANNFSRLIFYFEETIIFSINSHSLMHITKS